MAINAAMTFDELQEFIFARLADEFGADMTSPAFIIDHDPFPRFSATLFGIPLGTTQMTVSGWKSYEQACNVLLEPFFGIEKRIDEVKSFINQMTRALKHALRATGLNAQIRVTRLALTSFSFSQGNELAADIYYQITESPLPKIILCDQLYPYHLTYLIERMQREVEDVKTFYVGGPESAPLGRISDLSRAILSTVDDFPSVVRQCRMAEQGSFSKEVGFHWRSDYLVAQINSTEDFHVTDDCLVIAQELPESVKSALLGKPLKALIEAPGLPLEPIIRGFKSDNSDPGKLDIDLELKYSSFDLVSGDPVAS